MQGDCEVRDFLGVPAVVASDAMRRILAIVEKVAVTNASVLITGESGSGKEVIARALHHYSLRASRTWVDINCAALPENLMESELFGYEKGAFSGANASKPGLFELANHGTLFLDEIGDVDLRLQAKLLRVLDGAPYYRLGGVRKVSVDVRLITATNQELTSAVAQGRFRSDLYHRLSQLKLSVPPLRERLDDIIPLAHHYLEQQQPGMGIAREAEERLRSYSWPGNVRELRNVILRASIFASGTEITVAELPEEFAHACVSQSLEKLATLDQLERRSIIEAMSECGGHQGRTASTLGISVRTLQRKLKSYGMSKGAEEESS